MLKKLLQTKLGMLLLKYKQNTTVRNFSLYLIQYTCSLYLIIDLNVFSQLKPTEV